MVEINQVHVTFFVLGRLSSKRGSTLVWDKSDVTMALLSKPAVDSVLTLSFALGLGYDATSFQSALEAAMEAHFESWTYITKSSATLAFLLAIVTGLTWSFFHHLSLTDCLRSEWSLIIYLSFSRKPILRPTSASGRLRWKQSLGKFLVQRLSLSNLYEHRCTRRVLAAWMNE